MCVRFTGATSPAERERREKADCGWAVGGGKSRERKSRLFWEPKRDVRKTFRAQVRPCCGSVDCFSPARIPLRSPLTHMTQGEGVGTERDPPTTTGSHSPSRSRRPTSPRERAREKTAMPRENPTSHHVVAGVITTTHLIFFGFLWWGRHYYTAPITTDQRNAGAQLYLTSV